MPNVIRVQRIGGDGAVLVKINLGESPRWSPSGQLISFYHAGEIWTMHRMGKSMLRITNERGHGTTFRHHAWSPDGTKMIYYIEEADRKGFKIVYLDLVGIGKKLGITCSPSGSNAAAPPSAPGPSTPPAAGKGATANYDGVYVATAVTGEKIPHPLSKKTYPFHYGGRTIQVPEGMVFVSGGPFIMGDDNQPKASPAHEVDVEAFFIGKYEVTNAEYMEFVNTTGYPMPKYFAENGNGIPKGRENHPVTGVSWEDAERYCNWCGKRLPTEREWEKAASWDPVKRRTNKYVWGDKWDEDPAHPMFNWAAKWGFGGTQDYWKWRRSFEQSKQGRTLLDMGGPTTAVGSFRKDRSASRCYDMAGNVDEWVADWFDKYPGNTRMSAPWESKCGQVARVTRGGCWASPQGINLQCAERGAWEPSKVDNAIGFRCATDCPWKPK
jgi:formylglycine-generating enzyme required for sulfatase activity